MLKDYRIAWGETLQELENAVIDHVRDGWTLQGGISYANTGLFMQALVLLQERAQ